LNSINQNKTYTISELAEEFDITTRTIRFYEEKKLLKPDRNGSNRLYSSADRVKLKLILRGKRLGFTLEESREIVDMYNPTQGNTEQLQSLISIIREKRKHLEQQLHDLEGMMLDLRDSEERCLNALAEQSSQPVNYSQGNNS
jgi:DNA-binding transcriptional MerR regulator